MVFTQYTTKTPEQLFSEFSVTEQGLSVERVLFIRKHTGENRIDAHKIRWYELLLKQFSSPFLYLLLGAAALSFFLSEKIDAIMILFFVSINSVLGFYQEFRSEKTLALLKQFIVSKTTVVRNGEDSVIPSSELVLGDIVHLHPGDIIPADLRIIESESLTVDESLLTGESVNTIKSITALGSAAKEAYEATNIGFSGTTVISGAGKGIVIAAGKNTALGSIAKLTVETKHESSFEKGVSKLSTFILKLISITIIFIVIINLFLKGTSEFPTLLIFAIALAISVIPEALPVITTFCLSRGALHLARNNVVVKRLSSIEDLGSVEVLCTDKTGTITENKMSVSNFYPHSKDVVLMGSLATAILTHNHKPTDAFDIALLSALNAEDQEKQKGYKKIKELPFDPKRRRNSMLLLHGKESLVVVRGAAESILPLCTESSLNDKKALHEWITAEGKAGKRVIAIAKRTTLNNKDVSLEELEHGLMFVGLVSFVDPLKKTAKGAIEKAERLGVKIKIITGDSRDVAGAIALQVGLITDINQVMTGEELEKLSVHQQHEAVKSYAVFARVSPEQKHRIIELLKETYDVGYLGEGINDAPALKAANVSLVVQEASGIAREAADIVLLNKSLHVVVDGIKEGRVIFGNTAKYIKATLASNFGNFYTLAILSLFIPFLPLLPLQILLINLLTDFPMLAVATDTVDESELKRPKNYDIKEIALFATIMGIVSSFFDFLFFVFFFHTTPQILQTSWFIGSVLTELVFIFSVRSRLPIFKASLPSVPLFVLSGTALVVAIALPFTVFGHEVFSFITPTSIQLVTVILLTSVYFITTETVKNMYYKFIETK